MHHIGSGRTRPRSRNRPMASLFHNRWWIVFATICGLAVGAGPINVFTFGVFLKPITEDLGLSRGAFSAALTFHAAIAAIVLPIIGWLVDRWGARRIMLPGLFLYALATASYALIQASPLLLTFLIFAFTGLVGGVQSPIPYAAVIAQRFDRRRGLALGIGTAGVGLGVALMPQLAALLIDAFGWRLAYVGLAVAVLVVAFPPVAMFLRDPPGFARAQRLREPADAGAAVPGVAAGAALRSWLFWGLAIAFFLDVIAINGTLTHIVPLLTDRGVPRQIATAALSGTGFALIFGRVLSGWCLDRPSYRTLNQHHLKRNRKFVDSPLEEAVRSELVSEGYFPASWENTGKFVDSGLSHPNFQSKALVDQRLTVRIPCEMEQGNNCALAGN